MIPWYLFAIGSAFFLAISRVLEKKVLNAEHALEFSTSSGIFRMIILFVLLPFIDFSMLSMQGFLFIYFVSILGVFAFLFRSKATRHMSISEVDPLFNLQPLFLIILSYVFLHETLNAYQLGGVFLLLAGTYILEIEEESWTFMEPIKRFLNSRYMPFIVFTLLAFSLTAVFDKIIINDVVDGNVLTYLFLFYLFLGVNFLILDLARFGVKDVAYSLTTRPLATFLAMFLHLINIFFYLTAVAIPGALISLIIPIRRMSSLFSVVIGGKVFHEDHLPQKFVASLIMIGGMVLIIAFT